MAQFALAAVQAAGTIYAGKQNAKALKLQAIAANQQSVADEEAVRRSNRQFLGAQAGAIAESGLGYEGTAGLIAQDSEANAELDALNTRYVGRMRGIGLIGQANATRAQANLLAGQQLLNGIGSGYASGERLPSFGSSAQSKRMKWNAGAGNKPVAYNPARGSY